VNAPFTASGGRLEEGAVIRDPGRADPRPARPQLPRWCPSGCS